MDPEAEGPVNLCPDSRSIKTMSNKCVLFFFNREYLLRACNTATKAATITCTWQAGKWDSFTVGKKRERLQVFSEWRLQTWEIQDILYVDLENIFDFSG